MKDDYPMIEFHPSGLDLDTLVISFPGQLSSGRRLMLVIDNEEPTHTFAG